MGYAMLLRAGRTKFAMAEFCCANMVWKLVATACANTSVCLAMAARIFSSLIFSTSLDVEEGSPDRLLDPPVRSSDGVCAGVTGVRHPFRIQGRK